MLNLNYSAYLFEFLGNLCDGTLTSELQPEIQQALLIFFSRKISVFN